MKLIRRFVRGLEVEKNKYWEWQEAIVEGHKIYAALHKEKQGTVSVDLDARTVQFDERVSPNALGPIVSIGSATCELTGSAVKHEALADARKTAILRSLGFDADYNAHFQKLNVIPFGECLSVKATGEVQERIWNQKIVEFRKVETEVPGALVCNIVAVSWDKIF